MASFSSKVFARFVKISEVLTAPPQAAAAPCSSRLLTAALCDPSSLAPKNIILTFSCQIGFGSKKGKLSQVDPIMGCVYRKITVFP